MYLHVPTPYPLLVVCTHDVFDEHTMHSLLMNLWRLSQSQDQIQNKTKTKNCCRLRFRKLPLQAFKSKSITKTPETKHLSKGSKIKHHLRSSSLYCIRPTNALDCLFVYYLNIVQDESLSIHNHCVSAGTDQYSICSSGKWLCSWNNKRRMTSLLFSKYVLPTIYLLTFQTEWTFFWHCQQK